MEENDAWIMSINSHHNNEESALGVPDLFNSQRENKRTICKQCERPERVCWCNYLPNPKVLPKSRTTIIILQHPSEKKRNIRTALMALHGIADGHCQIHVRRKLTKSDSLYETLQSLNCFLLFPSATSKNITTLASHDDVEKTLVILDGTWDEAKKIYMRSPVLQALPCIHLEVKNKSAYVVRTQPSEKCLSTLETAAHALAIIEKNPSIIEKLLNPLRMLCEFQLSHGAVEHDNKVDKKDKG